MDELYLDNIDEYVNDHNKIVTYKWLSLTLGVHVNTAKQMLYHYLDHKRKESSAQLHATYLVSGKFVDNGQTSHKVSVVREEQLEDFKAKMSLVVSVHVYSVQKALLKDSGPLYAVDYDAVKDNLKNCSRYSAIRCASAVPMSSVELQQRGKFSKLLHLSLKTKAGMNGDTSPVLKSSAKPPKGIMGMFANKSAPKSQDNSKEMKPEKKEDAHDIEAPKSKPVAKVNPVANFFGTQTSKKPEKTVKEEEAPQSSSRAAQQHERSKPEEKQETVAPVEPQKDTKKDSRSKTKRLEDSDSEEEKMKKKKRRRIKKPEPDSSDEDVIPDSPQPVVTREPSSPSPKKEVEPDRHSHPSSSEMKIRKRRRVMKSRIFVDDDGCMVTEKGYVSESYSESEDDFKPSKQASRDPIKAKPSSSSKEDEKKTQKKASANSNKGTKQASIMGFFQKK
ncbi:LOW QUALITY PROTEIN: DNA polymerase delta subunit 3 [Oreochromis aureus]|uniref:LOW QUALITY PROTEIN: DNA polymerase delta subunit 3 n=1 Tax=Oreochromis aureus TaxID=47969 RepID=UPI00195447BB|nr:LOW QUALITY PROTEIN: DNA polymerase delta subunit 3 [Oreochromis aureus]